MPIYEYQCPSCGATKELILKPGEEPRPSCTGCRKRMKRIISPTAFILKGAGWFVNDYPSQDRKKGLESEKEKAPSAAKESTGKEAAGAVKKPAEAGATSPRGTAAKPGGEKGAKRKGRARG